ncbi:MAG: SWIM zinc finger family protein [Thermoanaerobaculia bacterium]
MSNKTATRGRRRSGRSRRRDASHDGKAVPLYKRTASHFDRADRDRGTEYFEEGRVELELDGSRARASVKGNERESYRVGADWTQVGERILHGFCECRRFADGRPCKHLWATLLALDAAGGEGRPPGRDRLSLRKDRAANWGDLGVQPREDPPRRSRGSGRGRSRGARRGEVDSWRSRFETVRDALARSADSSHESSLDVQLLINTAASDDSLVLDVFSGGRGRGGRPKPTSIEPEDLESILLPVEEDDDELQVDLAVIPALLPEPASRRAGARAGGRPGACAGSSCRPISTTSSCRTCATRERSAGGTGAPRQPSASGLGRRLAVAAGLAPRARRRGFRPADRRLRA